MKKEQSEKEKYRTSFERLAKDKDVLLLAEEGLGDYTHQLKEIEK